MKRKSNSSTVPTRPAKTVRAIRLAIGFTQADLARTLGVSPKAVQSYEQGWRNVPVPMMVQLLTLFAIHRQPNLRQAPCWKLTHCPAPTRTQCASYRVGKGQFCWLVTSRECRHGAANRSAGGFPCLQCAVIGRLFKGV